MIRTRFALLLPLLAALATFAAAPAAAATADGPDALVRRYVDAVRAGDWEAARSLWSAEALAVSAALDIGYPASPFPPDLASPLLLHADDLRAGRMGARVGAPERLGDGFAVPVGLVGDASRPPHRYAVVPEGDGWRLALPLWAATRTWPRVESDHFVFLCREPDRLRGDAVASLEAFADSVLTRLEVPPERRAALRRAKIPYVLADDATVEALTGYATRGMADLAAGMLVSSHFPHYHEAAHLLVNFALGEAPLHPLPVIQEGTASLLGGRWGRSAGVILHLGRAQGEMGFVDLGAILTPAGFHAAAGGPDATYPAAALLCEWIVATGGWPALLDLHARDVPAAGPGPDANAVARLIAKACGRGEERALPVLLADVRARSARFGRAGVAPGAGPSAGAPDPAAGAPVRVTAGPDGWLRFDVPAAGDDMVTVLPPAPAGADTAGGVLFGEVVPGEPWRGRRGGVRCSPSGVSVYDFTTDRLVGVWVGDFVGESRGAAAPGGRLVFRVDPDLLADGADAAWAVVAP